MRVQNSIDRYHIVLNAIKYVKLPKKDREEITSYCMNQLVKHYHYIRKNGVGMPDVNLLK
jgi:phosphoketolase